MFRPFLMIMYIWQAAKTQILSEFAFNLFNQECQKQKGSLVSPKTSQTASLCKNPHLDINRNQIIFSQFGESSENAYFAGLAEIKSSQLKCTKLQMQELLTNPVDRKEFISDYIKKIQLIGIEKRIINEIRDKKQKTQADLDDYDNAVKRANLYLSSLPFGSMETFNDIVTKALQQYDSFTPDRLQSSLPQQMNRTLEKSLGTAFDLVARSVTNLDAGVESFGNSLDTFTKQSLAQDNDLIEIFRNKNRDNFSEMAPVACAVDAKYATGAKYVDHALLGISVIGLGVGKTISFAGRAALASSVAGASAVGKISNTTAGIMRAMAYAGGSIALVNETAKACTSEENSFSISSCEKKIMKQMNANNCLLLGGITALGGLAAIKATYEFISYQKMLNSISRAHAIGHLSPGADGSIARVGNYSYQQILQKARELKAGGLTVEERRILFKNKVVGDPEYLDRLLALDARLNKVEIDRKKYLMNKNFDQEIVEIRRELDEILDAGSEAEAISKMSSVESRLQRLEGTKDLTSKVSAVNSNTTQHEMPTNFEQIKPGQLMKLGRDPNSKFFIQFEDDVLKQLTQIEKIDAKKFFESIERSVQNGKVDPNKVKILNKIREQENGALFEVRIVKHGHSRLFGCFKDGVYKVIKFVSQAPENISGYYHYENLCK